MAAALHNDHVLSLALALLLATSDAEKFVRAHLADFAAGYLETWAASIDDDALLIPADPAEPLVSREAIVAELHNDFDPAFESGMALEIEPKRIVVRESRDGTAAWTATTMRYKVRFGGATFSFERRNTSLLHKKNDAWSVAVSNDSQGVRPDELVTLKIPRPSDVAPSPSADTRTVVAEFESSLRNPRSIRTTPNAFLVGALSGEELDGAAVAPYLARRLSNARLIPGAIRARIVSGTPYAFVATNAELDVSDGTSSYRLPHRILFIYERVLGRWRLAGGHISLGIPDPDR
ncbi:MAG TPA: nuclear transport factor 2 family protein [Thermoanaerobaculia bacterium]|nr:nuclear transport factor 2 family protein [Thermoanaerobaculia bacterium]